ncbi:hypothetical protein [Dyella sp. C11]|uniref:hypothetical protein n=1 Tax=Dyella sp. C11 TaxID=2126991 RepID=UPI0013003B3F|nr:hypothetical protein [Dyella sp. C11]
MHIDWGRLGGSLRAAHWSQPKIPARAFGKGMRMKCNVLLFLCICAISFSNAFAQQPSSNTNPEVNTIGNSVQFRWQQLEWSIPREFFWGFRPYTHEDKEVLVQLGYDRASAAFVDANRKKYDILLHVHIRKLDNEDPKTALSLIHRAGLAIDEVPEFKSASFPGMTYIGSSSSFHYFKLTNEDADVQCHLLAADRLLPPKVSPDVLSKEFICSTAISLPSDLYAWIVAEGVQLNDVANAFVMAHRKVISFTH